jgi:thioredoxin-related protein
LEGELGDRLLIIRLNIQEEVGHELASAYAFEFTPTFIYFDSSGTERWRQVGIFEPQLVRESLKLE